MYTSPMTKPTYHFAAYGDNAYVQGKSLQYVTSQALRTAKHTNKAVYIMNGANIAAVIYP